MPEGLRHSLKDIKKAVIDDLEYQNMSKEKKALVCTQLVEHRNTKATAARASNVSTARDVASTMAIQEREVCIESIPPTRLLAYAMGLKMQALSQCTGAHVVTFMTRSHVNDQIVPAWFATSGSMHFFMDTLNLSAWDILRLMEQWACSKSASALSFPLAALHANEKYKILFNVRPFSPSGLKL